MRDLVVQFFTWWNGQTLGTRLCVARSTVEQSSGLSFRRLGALLPRGKTGRVEILQPVPEPAEMPHLADYEQAYALLAAEDPAARAAFEQLAQTAPEDPVIALHLSRLAAGACSVELDMRPK